MAGQNLIELDHATVVRSTGDVALRDLTWTLRDGETWAIVGPIASGKTTLADALVGKLHVESGTIAWPLLDRLRAAGRHIDWVSEVVKRVSFKEDSRLFSYGRHYYQQRFNFIEPADDLTLEQFLRDGVDATDDQVRKIAERLGIAALRDLSLIKLSNGQTRRARIARALLTHPEMLILDEPFMGLDATGRIEVADILGELVQQGTRILLITRPDSIPLWVTHVLELDRMSIRWQGLASEYQPPVKPVQGPERPPAREDESVEPIVEMRHVNVAYGDRPILTDISWTVRAGERWALLGPNGSGKTTLLSLIAADHPQAYGNDITLFGRKRGSGESIWDIKRNIGLVSPEMHLYFTEPLSAFRAAATGYFDVLAYRAISADQERTLLELFSRFGIDELKERPFGRLSTGEQRLVLIIRALVKAPALLILDEPFQGLDARYVERLRDWLDSELRRDQVLIFVTHLQDEIPRTVRRRLVLANGLVNEIC